MKKLLIIIAACIVGWFALGEGMRVYGRTQIEENMRAQFERNLCAKDQINGDVCVAFPKEGRCLSGTYIDYRTVWGRVFSVDEVFRVVKRAYEREGSAQRLANWFACQGFGPVMIGPIGPERARDNNVPAHYVNANARFWGGYGPFATGYPAFPVQAIVGHTHREIVISIDEPSGPYKARITTNPTLN